MLSRGVIVLACFHLIAHYHVTGNERVTNVGTRFRDMMLSTIGNDPTDLVIVLDSSGSVGATNYDKSVVFVKTASLIFPIQPAKTRVAIVSYSSCGRIHTYVDYITTPAGKNKCTFNQDIDSNVRYDGGGTCTNNALQRAGQVLSQGRSGVNKVIMLSTDGASNDGGPPLNTAQGLKNQGITIFSIGLGSGINEAELEAIATSVENHLFYLEQLGDVSDFGDVIKSDVKDDDFLLLSGNACPSSCGPNSVCSCATKSGVQECVCNAGFYNTPSGCTGCPRGTYKTVRGNIDCKLCPTHSSTSSTGSLSRADCECDTGYQGTSNDTCEAVQCPEWSSNQSGVAMIPSDCPNTYSSTPCQFECLRGYRASRGSRSSRCTENGDWSHDFLQCERITCPALTPPQNADVTCSPPNDNSLGTTCSITCHNGYEMVGSAINQGTAECQSQGATNGAWSRHDWKCQKKTCQPLEVVSPMLVEPAFCQNIFEYGQECTYRCGNGFSLNSSDDTVRCTATGTWSSPSPRVECIDTEPPSITCPGDITGTTDKHKPTRLLNWTDPAASDNSGAPPTLTPSHEAPYDFPIGVTVVTYNATDMAGETSQCTFAVLITDEERPRVRECPADVTVNTSSTHADVTWEEPEFVDNAGNYTIVIDKYNATPGSPFPVGDTNVVYTATDPSGNNNTCEFTITVTQHSCKYYPPPLDGALTCHEAGENTFCSVLCNKYYTFAGVPESIYICDATKEWVTGVSTLRPAFMPWPDCTVIPPNAGRTFSKGVRFYAGPCDTENKKIRKKFLSHFESLVLESSNGILSCNASAGCNIKGVQVTCSEAGNRRRRQVGSEGVLTVTFTATVVAPPQDTDTFDQRGVPPEGIALDTYIDSIRNVLTDGDISIDDTNITLDATSFEVDDDYVVSCEPGEILVDDLCLQCPPGTGQSDNRCERCPVGTYQDEYGQVQCKNCSDGTSTVSRGSRSSDRCRALCEPGTYSASGVKSCVACGEGFYQPEFGSKSCLPCREGYTTWTIGSASEDECTNPCPKGYVSYTGFKPCTPCSRGFYQPDIQQSQCIICPAGMYTHETGAHAIEYCQVIDECELNQPCGPGSTCVDLTHGYRCDCAPGYAGEHCEVDIDECSNNDACLNGGRCEDLVAGYRCECPTGYAGANCQINVDDCIDAYCRFGATCIDGLNSYTCQCQDGFAGEHCEINLYDCASDPCQNGASCIDLQADFSCCCLPGYTGRFCEEIKDYCASAPCYGGANCTSTITNYECACPPGFTSRDCDVDIDECSAVSCENGGTCKDLINGFQCACPLGFIGEQCEQVLSSDFDLPFPSARTTDRAELEGVLPDLFEFTLSFWMTTSDQENYGTPVSYAVRGQNDEEDMDNALTLQDYNNLVLFVNGEAAFTYVQANRDSNWRFITVTWTSETGAWAIYVDGRRENSGSDLSRGNLIRGRGMFVVGQEQDSYAGSYVSRESFIGTITQVNVWDYAMNPDEILDVHASCTHSGNAISWSQLSTGIRGQITARTPSAQCGAIDMCEASYCMNGGVCVENQSGRFCVCSQGWYGPRCETEAVPCALGAQCLNGGSCMGQNGVCACPIGVEGRNCEDVVGCDSLQCQNGSICSISMGKPVCACSSGFTGRRCQFDVNECSSDNGGCDHICQNSFGSFSCSCNRGYVLQEDGKTCNDISFCEYKGTFYARGNTLEDGCDECICQNGRAQCSPRTCPVLNCNADETEIWLPGACCPTCLPETKTCSLDTAGNHTTFDGYRFESMGKCRYVLTQDCGGTANFEVHVQHEPTSGKTRMNLTLYIYVDCVEITISPNGTVNVFNETLALPYVHDSPQNVRIENIGEDDILVTTNKGLFVEWSSTEVRVRLSTQYRSTACGLCGNMNGQEADDGLTREFIKSKRKQILLHGWRVDGNKYCKKREAKSETGIRFGKIEAEWCSDYDQLTEARGKCKIFKKNKFKACYKYVDPTPYYKLCLEDTCTCGVTESCYCEPISAYVNECQRNGVAIKSWKRQTSCYITCYHSEVYDDCGPPCRATCEDPEGQSCTPSPVVCKAGCQCKAGRVLHDGQCIRIDDCPS